VRLASWPLRIHRRKCGRTAGAVAGIRGGRWRYAIFLCAVTLPRMRVGSGEEGVEPLGVECIDPAHQRARAVRGPGLLVVAPHPFGGDRLEVMAATSVQGSTGLSDRRRTASMCSIWCPGLLVDSGDSPLASVLSRTVKAARFAAETTPLPSQAEPARTTPDMLVRGLQAVDGISDHPCCSARIAAASLRSPKPLRRYWSW
jgi:hypothetical protein